MAMKKLVLGLAAVAGLVLVVFWLSRSPTTETGASTALTLLYNAEEQPSEKALVSQVLQAQLQKAGITVKLEPAPSTVFNDRLGKGQFQAVLALWYLDYDDAEGFLTDFYSKASFRMSKYSSPAFDTAYERGLFTATQEEKLKHFHEAEAILRTDLPWVPLFSNTEIFLLRKTAKEFRSNAYQYYDYRRIALAEIRAASDVEVQTLDPAQAYDLASKHLVTQSYEGLIAMDKDNKIVPALATEWIVSPAGDSIVFVLRAGVQFHASPFLSTSDQRTLDAGDVKASFERVIKANSPYTYIFEHVQGVDEFKAGKATEVSGFVVESPLQFRLQLKRPLPTMLPWLLAPAAYLLPKELPKDFDFARSSSGTGPFVLKTWDGSTARFVANEDYWLSDGGEHLPRAKSLTLRIIKDANTQFLAFKQSELDLMNVPLALYDAVLDSDGNVKSEWSDYEYREVKLNNLKFIAFNMESAPWGKDVNLRRKVDTVLDRNSIVKQLFKGKARVARSIVPQGVAGFAP